ncbi:hypothetical protein J6T21_03745 [Candidatus Saccharibacteria bacterium]|nr:hypothetical protein [Candidatus Saccharibacteria bacterium]
MEQNNRPPMDKGARNIIILGIVATVITIILTVISMMIYHNSGDIYLDRSRPGYLPDEEEIEENEKEPEDKYVFSDSGAITDEVIDEFLENLNKNIEGLEKFIEPFAPQSLSDISLGIPEVETEE